jgi:hypothetical protein
MGLLHLCADDLLVPLPVYLLLLQIRPPIPEVDPENEEFCVFVRTTQGVSTASSAHTSASGSGRHGSSSSHGSSGCRRCCILWHVMLW